MTHGAVAAAATLLATASCGTFFTRTHGDVVGWWPYMATVADAGFVYRGIVGPDESSRASSPRAELVGFGVFSLPFDLVIDTVLLPIDLIAALFGCEKGGPC